MDARDQARKLIQLIPVSAATMNRPKRTTHRERTHRLSAASAEHALRFLRTYITYGVRDNIRA